MKSIIIKSAFFLFIVLIGILLFVTGKTHVILPENKNIELNGHTYKAFSNVELTIDNVKMELYPRDRLKMEVKGQKHVLHFKALKRNGEEVEITTAFKLKLGGNMFLLNIPALAAEDKQWLQEFKLP